MRMPIMLVLTALTAACGSSHSVQHDAAAGAQLDAIDNATSDNAGQDRDDRRLLIPTPDQVGQQRRAAATKPPSPK